MTMMRSLMVALLLSGVTAYAADPLTPPPRPKSVTGVAPTPPVATDTVVRFVAVDIQGIKIWLGGGDLDLREYRGSKYITFKVLNKLDTDHGFAVDTLRIKQVVKPGEEVTFTVPLEDIEPTLSVYRYYCHLHPGHLGGTAVVTGKDRRSKEPALARATEESAKPDSEILKGRLLKIERGYYVIESAPGKEVRVSAPLEGLVDESGKGLVGEWIEAQISSDLHVTAIKKSPPTYMVEGDLAKVDGDLYVVADSPGNPVSLRLTKDTRVDGSSKVGDKIKAEFTPDGRAISIKKSPPASSSIEFQPAPPDRGAHAATEILKLDRDWISAVLRRDTMTLDRALADDATMTTWKSDVVNKAQYLGDISSGELMFKSIDIEGAKARVYGDAALVTGRYSIKGRYKEQDITGQPRYTNLYIRQQGAWRLVSHDLRLSQIPAP